MSDDIASQAAPPSAAPISPSTAFDLRTQLKVVLAASDVSSAEAAPHFGVSAHHFARFLRGERDLSLAALERGIRELGYKLAIRHPDAPLDL